ncbi:hypothetical protein CK203_017762 [Vitis vinifera]|uniref:Integrase zinc-binding domain-containing protein n=1 Tax=Vitis vinifera TaxID=29760 RepID=A0A438JGW0_VITVI|nr:hypothetical protein CK203_017762 [Vitis vinifera]
MNCDPYFWQYEKLEHTVGRTVAKNASKGSSIVLRNTHLEQPQSKGEIVYVSGGIRMGNQRVLFRCPSPKEQKPIYYKIPGPSEHDDQVNKNGGLCELTEPHAHQALELGSYYSPQLGNIWSRSSGWDSLSLTMKQNMRPSCPDWILPLLYPSPNSGSTATHNSCCLPPIKEAILLPIHVQANPSVAEISICNTIEANQADDQEWTYHITEYLRTSTLPGDPKQAHKIRVQVARFTLIGGHLYKRSFTGPYLRCLGHSEAQYVVAELHEGICGNHSGGRSLAHRAHSQGYYWPTMKKDAAAYVKKCGKCQRYAPIPHMPSATLKSVSGPWPFAQWGMDIVGPLPAAPAQKKFLLVATDYLVNGITFRNFCSELNIRNSYSTSRYPQSNGQAEATNKTLINALKKRLEQAKGKLVEELPGVLWAYRTIPGRPTGNTSFALAYGMDAVIPTEIGLPTIQTDAAKQDDVGAELGRNLDWADEVRENAAIRMADYQQRASAHYNRKVRPRSFKNGTLVLRKVFENTVEAGAGKFQANWEGPYIVSKASEMESIIYKS